MKYRFDSDAGFVTIFKKKSKPITVIQKFKNFIRSLLPKKKNKISLPIAKKVSPTLFSDGLVSVQPMALPQFNHQYITFSFSIDPSFFDNEIIRPEKIIGNTVEEYFMNLVIAWNKLDKNTVSHLKNHNNIIDEYCYKMKKLLEQYPEIINYYHYTLYDLGLLEIKGEERKHKFVGDRVKPKTIAGKNGAVCLWYKIINDDNTESYVLDKPDYQAKLITDLKSAVAKMLMES